MVYDGIVRERPLLEILTFDPESGFFSEQKLVNDAMKIGVSITEIPQHTPMKLKEFHYRGLSVSQESMFKKAPNWRDQETQDLFCKQADRSKTRE